MTTYDNAPPLEDWHVPVATFCVRLIGDDHCDCPSCQIDAAMPLDGRGDN
jgi:hypothetical protein